MSRAARKCDRCGKLYESYYKENKKLMPYNNGCGYRVNAVMAIRLNDNNTYEKGKEIDLCPECMEGFIEFMGYHQNDDTGQQATGKNNMDREILFRAKRKDNGEWLQGYLWEGNDSSYIIPHSLGINYYEKEKRIMAFASEVDPETVCQYTGLTDKNGRKIFEGDMLSAHLDSSYPEDITYVQITWDGFSWCMRESAEDDVMTEHDCNTFEVCGNIFDNPELLGVGTTSGQQAIREQEENNMDYKKLADVIRKFDDIDLLASEIESLDGEGVETIDELTEFLEDELHYAN